MGVSTATSCTICDTGWNQEGWRDGGTRAVVSRASWEKYRMLSDATFNELEIALTTPLRQVEYLILRPMIARGQAMDVFQR
jgi:hypothetical protein